MSYPFLKGHGTENDFVLLPDHDGTRHGDLAPERVRALCDRRAGIGGDGVLRVVRRAVLAAMGVPEASSPEAAAAEWFMDYRNSDGSVSEMCGNGVRVFARHLVEEGLAAEGEQIPVATRDGIKLVTVEGDLVTVDMGTPRVLGDTKVSVPERSWAAVHVDMGNPHAVAFVDDLADAGPLLLPPTHDPALYPDGVNVEFVVRAADHRIAMRVHERGSGETRSCGTGACAAMVAAAVADDAPRPATYDVEVPGGHLRVTWTEEGRALLAGPAVVVARGETSL